MRTYFWSLLVGLSWTACVPAQSPFDQAKLAWSLQWDADWVTTVSFVGNNRLYAGNNLGDILAWTLPDKADDKAPLPDRKLEGHTNVVNRLLTTPDQKWLLSASNDHRIFYWDTSAEAKDGARVVLNERTIEGLKARKASKLPAPIEVKLPVQKPTKELTAHKDWVLGLALSRDGNLLLSGDDKGEVIVWDRPTGKEIRRWKLKGWAYAMGLHPESKTVAISERLPLIFDTGRYTALKIWDPNTGELKADLSKDFKEVYSAAAYSPDGKWLAIGRGGESESGKVTLLDAATGKKVREFTPGHVSGLTDLLFHPDGKHLFSCGRDTVVRIWRLEDGKMVKELGQGRGGQFKDWLHSLALSPDGRWLAAGDMAGFVQVWALAK